MRRADAPRAGWYPDPENRTNLRWWDGLDWTDVRRAPPTEAELVAAESAAQFRAAASDFVPTLSAERRQEAEYIAGQVRDAARTEIERSTAAIDQRVRRIAAEYKPLVTDYTNRTFTWIKRLLAILLIVVIVWFVVRVFAEAALFDFITDQIDNLTDENGAGGSFS